MPPMIHHISSETDMRTWAAFIGARLKGGECLELIGDVGAGKTTFVKGLAQGLGVTDDVQSPSFTLSRVYGARNDLRLDHYDFYRLPEAGLVEYELAESLADKKVVTVIEWSGIVNGILPKKRLSLTIVATSEAERQITIAGDETTIKELIPV